MHQAEEKTSRAPQKRRKRRQFNQPNGPMRLGQGGQKNSTEVTTGQRPLPIFILCTPRRRTNAHTSRGSSKR